jgi:hypothetical protein
LGGDVQTIKKNTEPAVVASKEIGLDVNADKAKYMVMSRDQNIGRIRNIKNYNISFEKSGRVQIFGKKLKKKKSIQEEIRAD